MKYGTRKALDRRNKQAQKAATLILPKPNPDLNKQKIAFLRELKDAKRRVKNLVELMLEDNIDVDHLKSLGVSWKNLSDIFSVAELKRLGYTLEDYLEYLGKLDFRRQLSKLLKDFSLQELEASEVFRDFMRRNYPLRNALENKISFHLLVLIYPMSEFRKYDVLAKYLLLYGASQKSLLDAGYSQRQINSAMDEIRGKK